MLGRIVLYCKVYLSTDPSTGWSDNYDKERTDMREETRMEKKKEKEKLLVCSSIT